MAMRATHLILLLNFEAFDKTINLAFISLQFMEKLLGPFIREETIEVILLPGEKGIEIYLLSLLFLGNFFRGLNFFFFHENPSLYRTAHRFCQLRLPFSHRPLVPRRRDSFETRRSLREGVFFWRIGERPILQKP
jgi:hypothetical protein